MERKVSRLNVTCQVTSRKNRTTTDPEPLPSQCLTVTSVPLRAMCRGLSPGRHHGSESSFYRHHRVSMSATIGPPPPISCHQARLPCGFVEAPQAAQGIQYEIADDGASSGVVRMITAASAIQGDRYVTESIAKVFESY